MAAPILSYEGLGLVQGSGWLFQDLDIYVGARDRLALIGRNGAGKTTLLKLLAGKIDADKGKRVTVPGTHVVSLDQDPDCRTEVRRVGKEWGRTCRSLCRPYHTKRNERKYRVET